MKTIMLSYFFTETKTLKWGPKGIKPIGKVFSSLNMGVNPCIFHYKHRVVEINTSFEMNKEWKWLLLGPFPWD